jgi:hypothetical protein
MRQITYTKDVDLNLICHSGDWYKTTNNCFVDGRLLDGTPGNIILGRMRLICG